MGKWQHVSNTVSYTLPSTYDLNSIDHAMFRQMICDNGDLQQDLRKVGGVLVTNNNKTRQLESDCEKLAIVVKARACEVK